MAKSETDNSTKSNWFSRNNVLLYLVLIGAVLWGFYGPEKDDKAYLNWENASILVTLAYAVIIYALGLFGGRFKNIKSHAKIGIISIFLGCIFLIMLPFLFLTLRGIDPNYCGKISAIIDPLLTRTIKMGILFFICLAFCVIDILMIIWKNEEINYHINLKFSDAPIAIAVFILWLYSMYNTNIGIIKYHLEPFFAGAIAIQLIISNIIWSYNDDKLFIKRGE